MRMTILKLSKTAKGMNEGAMSRFFGLMCASVLLLLAGCAGKAPDGMSRVAVMGDSMMAWNGLLDASVPDVLGEALQEPVTNFAVSGARVRNPLPISSTLGFEIRRQFRKGPWEVILVNGGANDLFLTCGCRRCDARLGRMISDDGLMGELPDMLKRLRAETEAQVIFVGYHRARGLRSPARGCRDELDALDARVALLAEAEEGISFVSLRDVFPRGDASYYASDILHPSPKGSAAIAARLAPHVAQALARGRASR